MFKLRSSLCKFSSLFQVFRKAKLSKKESKLTAQTLIYMVFKAQKGINQQGQPLLLYMTYP
jgi:hypothetical protein